eukprot:COSAG01_NODE_611_length_14848_cov_207.046308_16_plen_85_part_00
MSVLLASTAVGLLWYNGYQPRGVGTMGYVCDTYSVVTTEQHYLGGRQEYMCHWQLWLLRYIHPSFTRLSPVFHSSACELRRVLC